MAEEKTSSILHGRIEVINDILYIIDIVWVTLILLFAVHNTFRYLVRLRIK